jgi:amino acid adenylation domain-containing protein
MTLLAAFQMLLARLSGQEDIVVGTPIANRTRTEVEGVVGCFVNTLALRTRIVGTQRVREVLRRVREVALEAYAHQELPFEQVVDALHLERTLDRHPLVQVLFVWQDPTRLPQALGELAVEPLPLDNGTAKFELSLIMGESAQGLWGELEYNSELFAAQTIVRWQRQWQHLLESLVADAEGLISDLDLLSAEERHRLLQVCNATAMAYPRERCLHDLLTEQAARTPQAIALVCGQEQVSYGVLEQRSTQLAHLLRRRGVGPEQRVGLCMERSVDLIVGLWGILKAGGAYVPLDPGYPAERLALMLQDGQVTLVLTQREVAGRVPLQEGVGQLVLEEIGEQVAQEPQTPVLSGVQPENLAYVIYTSGSTGRPKGSSIQHRGLCSLAVAQQEVFALTAEDRVLQFASLSFDASIWEIIMALFSGASLHLERPHALVPGLAVLGDLRDQAITVATLPPSVLAALPAEEFPFLHTVISAGEACSADLVARWAQGRRFFNAYGPSETTVCATIAVCDAYAAEKLSIGRPIANMQVYVLDRYQQLVPIGVAGELYLGGAGLARGYCGQPALTAARFVPHPFGQEPGARLYRSGDRVRMREDGALEFLGRLDQQVKVRGFRIEPGEIEATLRQHPQVDEAVVVVREQGGERYLVAYLLAVAGRQALAGSELRAWLAGRLPGYLLPTHLVVLDALPLSPNGKLDRQALPALAAPEHFGERQAIFEEPQTSVEQMITDVWQEVLQRERISVHDNFFDIGGHSLLLLRVCSCLQASLHEQIPIIDMFRYTTIRSFAAYISRKRTPDVVAGQQRGVTETHRVSPERQRQLRREHRMLQSPQGERHD